MGGGREGDATLNALGSGWFRFRGWFVFCFGWSVKGSRLGCLAGLVWSGLAVLSSEGGVVTRSVLSGCLFVSYCMLHAVLVLSCLCAFDIELDIEDIELPASCSYRQQLDDPDRATRLSTVACLVKVS